MTGRLLLIFAFFSCAFGTMSQSLPQEDAPVFREKIYLRTDKARYIAGEMLWWKAYYVNGFTQQPDSLSKIVYVEILNDSLHRVMQAKTRLTARGADGSFFLSSTLPTGEYLLRAYTRWIKISDPENIFTRRIQIFNANSPRVIVSDVRSSSNRTSNHRLDLSVTTDGQEYRIRKPVRLSIRSTPAANLSVAVYRLDSQADTTQELRDYLWLPSDTVNQNKTLPSMDPIDLVPEIDGHIISGHVTGDLGKPVAGMDVGIGIPSSRGEVRLATTDSAGRFWFDIRHYYGPGKIIIRAINSSLSNYKISVDNPFDTSFFSMIKPAPSLNSNTLSTSDEKQAIGVQVQNIFWSQQLEKNYTPSHDTVAFYGRNYVQYLLDNYVRFPSMEEVLTEYVPEVNVRKRSRKPEFHVLDIPNKIFFVLSPLILLDGIPVSAQQILEYDPLKIKMLRVVTSNYFIGAFSYGGIVSLTTYREDAADLKIDPKTLVMDYEGLQLKTEFFSPRYDTPAEVTNRKPDFRSLLYWNPDVFTNEKGEAQYQFYTGDLKGRYLIAVEGINQQGKAGAAYSVFEVK